MATTNQTVSDTPRQKPEDATEFEGLTLDEIRHLKALVAVRKEFAKARIFEQATAIKSRNPFAADGKMKAAARIGSLPLKLVKGLNYTDYILLGVSVFGTAKKIFSLFRKRK